MDAEVCGRYFPVMVSGRVNWVRCERPPEHPGERCKGWVLAGDTGSIEREI